MRNFEDQVHNVHYKYRTLNDIDQDYETFVKMIHELDSIENMSYLDIINEVRKIYTNYGFIEDEFLIEYVSPNDEVISAKFKNKKIIELLLLKRILNIINYVELEQTGEIKMNNAELFHDFNAYYYELSNNIKVKKY